MQVRRQVYKAGRREDNVTVWGESNICGGVRFLPSERAAADRFNRAGRTPRVRARTRRRTYCATRQHLFLVSFSLTETDSLAAFPPHAASNKNNMFSGIETQRGGDTSPFCVHADGFSHTKYLKTKVWISSVNFGYNRLFSIAKSHFFHTVNILKSEGFLHLTFRHRASSI